jgi:hypothetical protein
MSRIDIIQVHQHPSVDVATAAERNQVLGHSRADIFERYYMIEAIKTATL